MDVDKSGIAITVLDHPALGRSVKVAYDPGALLRFAINRYANKQRAFPYEAGPTGFGLYDAVREAGFKRLSSLRL